MSPSSCIDDDDELALEFMDVISAAGWADVDSVETSFNVGRLEGVRSDIAGCLDKAERSRWRMVDKFVLREDE